MGIQTSVSITQGFGVIGELYDNSPVRGESFLLNSADPANNVFGRAFSIVSEGVAAAGNTTGILIYAGIMVNPKGSKLTGIVGNPLAPSITLANNTIAEIVNFGELIVLVRLNVSPVVAPGQVVIFENATGILALNPASAAIPSGYSRAYAVVDRFINNRVLPGGFSYAAIRLTTTA